ncbi:MAG: pyridoxal phosphate-dependent aminotransferase [Ignavibacteriales bacterium]|nr:pyridoxal phosphate-dependent aminotransferase [Ignavibacteriales bacterium]
MLTLSRKVASLKPSATLTLFARAKAMMAKGIDVVSLTAGEPDFPTPEPIKQAAIKAIQENFTKYTPNQGIPKLLEVVAEKFRRENNLFFDPSQILVSHGAKHSLFNAIQAVCNPGDEVIIPAPYWVSHPEMVKLAGAKVVVVETSPKNQFKITPTQLKKAITNKTKMFIFCSPSNPTGAVYSVEEISALARVVEKSGLYVLSDEIYEKVVYEQNVHFSIGSIESIRDKVITVNGVSKAYAMTGWRIGYMGGPKAIIAAAEKIQGQMTSNAASISQRAALAALQLDLSAELQVMVNEFDRRRRYLSAEFDKLGIEYIYPAGAFYLFFNAKKFLKGGLRTDDALCEHLLLKHNVAMVPGSGFGASGWMRISYACSMQELEKAVARLQPAFDALR